MEFRLQLKAAQGCRDAFGKQKKASNGWFQTKKRADDPVLRRYLAVKSVQLKGLGSWGLGFRV